MAERNMGRAWTRVVLYDRLPNLIVDPKKLRRSTTTTLGFDGDVSVKRDSFGIQFLGVPGGEDGRNIAGAVIPQICYEPIDNQMYDIVNPIVNANTVYWNQLEGKGAAGIPPIFKRLVLTNDNAVTSATDLPLTSSAQGWKTEPQKVQSLEYHEEYYNNSGLGFDSSPYGGVGPIAITAPAVDIPTPKTVNFIHQIQSGAGNWWGAKTKFDYKVEGCPFWVTIKPGGKTTPNADGSLNTAYISILITRDTRTSPVVGQDLENELILVISNKGESFVTYNVAGKARRINVDLPNLSESFQNETEIRVGFLMVCGRICIFCNPGTYTFVDLLTPNTGDVGVGFNLFSGTTEVYGYSCSAYVNVCPMTFYKKSWYIVPDTSGAAPFVGQKMPPYDVGSVKAGEWSDGLIINWAIQQQQYEDSGKKQMYAGQFNYYKEVDLVDPLRIMGSVGPGGPSLTYTRQNDQRNWWGNVFVLRCPENNSVSTKKFWACYLETKSAVSSSGSNLFSGFPIVYNLFFSLPPDVTGKTATEMSYYGSVDITNLVQNIQVSESLDNVKPSMIERKASVVVYYNDQITDLSVYLTRARGIKIWMRWSTSDTNPIDTSVDEPIFCGVAYGEQSSTQPGNDTVTFSCFDYWAVLSNIKVKNSPFYDGFELTSVIKDLVERAGATIYDNVDHTTGNVPFHFLGSGFAIDAPMHRYESQMSIRDCVLLALKSFPYYLHWSNNGVLNVSVVPGDFDFSKNTAGWDSDVKKTYYRKYNSAITDYTPEKLILNEISMTSTLSQSLYNSFMVRGVNRTTNQVITSTGSNRASLLSPNSVGYLGYVSEKDMTQPALDSQASVEAFLDRIMKMHSVPGFETTITTIGHKTPYRAGQFIKIKHDQLYPSVSTKFRVTEISQAYDGTSNQWLTKIVAYQITPGNFSSLSTTTTPAP